MRKRTTEEKRELLKMILHGRYDCTIKKYSKSTDYVCDHDGYNTGFFIDENGAFIYRYVGEEHYLFVDEMSINEIIEVTDKLFDYRY